MGLYRINVTSTGKYNNVETGHRYVFSKRKAIKLLRRFVIECQAHAVIEKFIKCGDCWCFSEGEMAEINEDIFFEALEKEMEIY